MMILLVTVTGRGSIPIDILCFLDIQCELLSFLFKVASSP